MFMTYSYRMLSNHCLNDTVCVCGCVCVCVCVCVVVCVCMYVTVWVGWWGEGAVQRGGRTVQHKMMNPPTHTSVTNPHNNWMQVQNCFSVRQWKAEAHPKPSFTRKSVSKGRQASVRTRFLPIWVAYIASKNRWRQTHYNFLRYVSKQYVKASYNYNLINFVRHGSIESFLYLFITTIIIIIIIIGH